MLKHRQDGLVGLHAVVLSLLVIGAFVAAGLTVDALKWIEFNAGVNWGLYGLGLLAAMAWIYHNLRGAAQRLVALSTAEAVRLTVQQVTRLMVVLFTLAFATKDVVVSRAFLLGFIALAAGLLLGANLVVPRWLTRVLFRRQWLRTVIVAGDEEAGRLQRWLGSQHYLGIEAVGYVTPVAGTGTRGAGWLGTVADLPGLLEHHAIDQVVCAQAEHTGPRGPGIAAVVEAARCRIRYFVDMDLAFGTPAGEVEHNEHYAFGASVAEPLENPLNRLLKRGLDIAIALPVVLLVLPPLILAVAAVQRRQSPGPVFYTQVRTGLNRRQFCIHKFRTMHADGGGERTRQATAGDARVYPFGRFLRRSSLDEMPQFWDVLTGTMSVSGPRPHLPEHDAQFAKLVRAYYKRHFVKPGITGLAQSKGFRGEVIESSHLTDRVRYDMIYVATWSLGLDLGIMVQTARQVMFPPRSAY